MNLISKIALFILDILEVFLIGFAVFFLVYAFVGQPLEIVGDSMVPTFQSGEQIIAEKVTSNFKEYQQKDIVVFKQPEDPNILVIKRVVAVPGDSFKISGGYVYVNGKVYRESYIFDDQTIGYGKIPDDFEIVVPQNSYILLGDNRANSTDSRKWGPIHKEDIVGKASIVFYPIAEIRLVHNDFGIKNFANKIKETVNLESLAQTKEFIEDLR